MANIKTFTFSSFVWILAIFLNLIPITSRAAESLTIYSGRSEELVGPLIENFKKDAGIDVRVRYGDTAELAATILEEGDKSPADVYVAQDAGALGAVANKGLLELLPTPLLSRVEERFRSRDNLWVGISGRARVIAYNTELQKEADLPASIFDFMDPRWKGKIGWAPTNGSFQAMITAMRILWGEDKTTQWLKGIQANNPKAYKNNTAILEAVAVGEVEIGFVNHYYLFRQLAEKGESFKVRNFYLKNGDPGALINVAGAAILKSSAHRSLAEKFITYLLSDQAQKYFSDKTYEYPLVTGIKPNPALPSLAEIQTPDMDLSNLADLEGTLTLLQTIGVL
jgi:iron(III) transport system substrate-binding protein